MFDYLIVGAGFAGATCARLLAESGNRVLVVDKRRHIGGNCYDEYNEAGILIHRYGPHIFHTQHKEVWAYVSQFTKWHFYQHKVLAYVDGQTVPMPINLDTINTLYGTDYTSHTVHQFFNEVKEDKDVIANSKDMVVSKVGTELYEKFFKNYTKKQWDRYPEELDKEVTARIPIRYNRDDRYFSDTYQGMPKEGYTKLFTNVLDHPNIHLLLQCDFKAIKDEISYKKLIYTGPIDEFFDYKYGALPYRSLDFIYETFDKEWYQKVGTVNYPNDYDFTRITEFKHLTGQSVREKTTIMKEVSTATGEPYYPIPQKENSALYNKYALLAEALEGVYFTGRLGAYKYANMDKVIYEAMELVKRLEGETQNAR